VPKIKTLEIEHYRGFFEKQVINFVIPSGKKGSELILIVGPNNSGKTTVSKVHCVMPKAECAKY
jgi:AAA15 family ATPase/GTPase